MKKHQLFAIVGALVMGIGLYLNLKRLPTPPKEPECQVTKDTLNPLIDVKSPEVAKVLEDGYSDKLKLYVQHVELKDKSILEYSEGGCIHFSFELTYSPYVPSKKFSHAIAKDALKKLERPLYFSPDKISTFQRALKKVLLDPDQAVEDNLELECGDATCSLTAIENRLILSYDMPL